MKVMPLFFFLCGAGLSFLPYPLDGDTVQLHQDYLCSIQSCVEHHSSAKWWMLWTYVLGREWCVCCIKSSEKDSDNQPQCHVWDSEAIFLVEFLERGATINGEQYVQALKKLTQWIWRVWPDMKMSQVLLHHDSARPHTSLCTREEVATIVWTVLPHPPYSPDFAPSVFHFLAPWKMHSEDAIL
jgi:hypothetical protein